MGTTDQTQDVAINDGGIHRLAVVGLILTIFPPAGFIVSVIAGRKSALRGKLSKLATIGTVVNAILLLVGTVAIVSLFRGGHFIDPRTNDPVTSDKVTLENLKKAHTEMHRYIKTKGSLPLKLDDLKSLDNFDQRVLADARGNALSLTWSPEGCKTTTGDAKCTTYSISAVSRKNHRDMSITYDAITQETFWSNVPKSSAK